MSQTFTGAAEWSDYLHSTPRYSTASIFADVISTDPNQPNSTNFNFKSQPSGSTNTVTNRTNKVAKPARKRSRASRRTPTTLLSTNTSNFRAMVQQFTGGPSASGFTIGTGSTAIEIPQPRRVTDQPARGVDGSGMISLSPYVNPWNYGFQLQQNAPPMKQVAYGAGDASSAVVKSDGGGGFLY